MKNETKIIIRKVLSDMLIGIMMLLLLAWGITFFGFALIPSLVENNNYICVYGIVIIDAIIAIRVCWRGAKRYINNLKNEE